MAPTDIENAWSAFFEDVAVVDPAELKKQGWLTNAEIAERANMENSAGSQLGDTAVRKGLMEKRAAKIMLHGKRHSVNFYRPKNRK